MISIIIRPCREEECVIVLDFWKEAETVPSMTDNTEALKNLLKNTNAVLLVAEYQNKLVGTVIAGWDGWRGNIYRLAVLPDYRRQNIGRLLVKEAENFLSTMGAQRIGGLVASQRPLSVSFWDALADAGYNRDSTFVRYTRNL